MSIRIYDREKGPMTIASDLHQLLNKLPLAGPKFSAVIDSAWQLVYINSHSVRTRRQTTEPLSGLDRDLVDELIALKVRINFTNPF